MKSSGIGKLVKAGFNLGKYPATAAVALGLMGCYTAPKSFTASQDGRYVLYAVDKDGDVNVSGSSLIRYDTLSGKVVDRYDVSEDDIPIWMTNEAGKIAYITSFLDHKTGIVVRSGDGTDIVPNGSYPDLSPDGNMLVYSRLEDSVENPFDAEIRLRNLGTKEDEATGVTGVAPNFSPDGKYFAYYTLNEVEGDDGDEDVVEFVVGVYSLETNKKTVLSRNPMKRLDQNGFNYLYDHVHWPNNDQVLYHAMPESGGEDSEIFLQNKDGSDRVRVTDNQLMEFSADMGPKGRLFYTAADFPSNGSSEEINGMPNLYVAEKKNGEWVSKDLKANFALRSAGIDPVFLEVAGDNLVVMFGTSDKGKPGLGIISLEDICKGDISGFVNIGEQSKRASE